MGSTQELINIQAIINTEVIINNYPNPSKDPNNPTGLPRNYMGMIATASDQTVVGESDLAIRAIYGDVIRWRGLSEDGNLDSTVILYKIAKFSGADVFSNATFSIYNRQGIVPINDSVIPANVSIQDFWFHQAIIEGNGTIIYHIYFALYKRERGQAPSLYGYYYWDPTLTING